MTTTQDEGRVGRGGVARFLWPAGMVIVWPAWFVLYGFTFSFVNELLTRVSSLTSENGMLATPFEIGLQVLLAAAFGFLGIFAVRFAKAPKNVWITTAVLSLVLSVATVVIWSMSEAGAGAEALAASYGTYALIGVAMGGGCWLGAKAR